MMLMKKPVPIVYVYNNMKDVVEHVYCYYGGCLVQVILSGLLFAQGLGLVEWFTSLWRVTGSIRVSLGSVPHIITLL